MSFKMPPLIKKDDAQVVIVDDKQAADIIDKEPRVLVDIDFNKLERNAVVRHMADISVMLAGGGFVDLTTQPEMLPGISRIFNKNPRRRERMINTVMRGSMHGPLIQIKDRPDPRKNIKRARKQKHSQRHK